jgi:hypothetical protein
MNRKISKEQEEEIIELYKTKSQKEISKIYNISQVGVQGILKRNNVEKQKNSRLNMSKIDIDINYFKNIDNTSKAYWLGYISGDGYISKYNNKVTLVSKDIEIIERFKIDIKSGHKIINNKYFDKRTNKEYNSYSIQITNEIFTKNLISNGITNKKSDCLNFPKINEEYYSYYLAGLFDSDGTLSNISKVRVSIISTIEIINFIQNYLLKNLKINELKIQRVTKNKDNIWKMNLYKDSKKFLDFIYFDDNFKYLSRKYEKYKNCVS